MSDAPATLTTETPTALSPTTESAASPQPVVDPPSEPTSILDAPKVDAPEPFDAEKLTLPDGFDRSQASFTEFATLAKDVNLSSEQAQKLIDLHLKHSSASADALMESWKTTQEGWITELKADKEIGNIPETLKTISKVLDNPEFTDPKFREIMALTGAGNHPAVIRTLYRVAKALSEGSAITGEPAARTANGHLTQQPVSLGQAFYGSDGPRTGNPNR